MYQGDTMNKIYQYAQTAYETEPEKIRDAIERMLHMYEVYRNNGILQLEAFVEEEEEFPGKSFLKKAVTYLCNGMGAEDMEALLINRIRLETDVEKQFLYLLYKSCIELIQKERSLCYMMEYLCSLFPEKCEEELRDHMKRVMKQVEEKRMEEKQRSVPKEFAKATISLPPELADELELFQVKMVMGKTDSEVLAWLNQMENFDVCSLLLAGNERFREHILSNMSSRLRIWVMEDVIARANELADTYEKEVEQIEQALDCGNRIYEIIGK